MSAKNTKPAKAPTQAQIEGLWGEEQALAYLVGKGYSLKERRYKLLRAEIDLIVQGHGILVFVEVKLRRNNGMGYPENFVTLAQAKRVKEAAIHYMEQLEYLGPVRYDIVAITGYPVIEQLVHLEDAF